MTLFSKIVTPCLVGLLMIFPLACIHVEPVEPRQIKSQEPAELTIKSRDIADTQGDVVVGNKYGLDEEKIKAILKVERQETYQKIGELLKLDRPSDQEEIRILRMQISALETKLANTEKALKDREAVLKKTKQALENEKLRNIAPADQLKAALKKLEQGDSSEAEAILVNILERSYQQVEAGAEAAFVLGKLSYDRVDYRATQKYYEKATQLAPDNSSYLNEAGNVANELDQYDKAIEYYEKALKVLQKTVGLEHPSVGKVWHQMGRTWGSKGNFDKAMECYGKAIYIFGKARLSHLVEVVSKRIRTLIGNNK